MKRRGKTTWIFSILLAVALCTPALATTIYVDDDADGSGTGTIGRPYRSIQVGIDRASYGDTVRVASGTYYEQIELKNGVRVIGGSGPPTIDGGGDGTVVTAVGLNSRTLFDGFRVVNGDASEGGGMYVEDSTLRIRYCSFEDNRAWSGGGIFLNNASPRITACSFENNRSSNGGGIDMQFDSNPIIERCDINNNTADHLGVSQGGGICIGRDCRPRITDCTIQNNYSGLYGGGMAVLSSMVEIENCVFQANRTDYYGYGGAIWAEGLAGAETELIIFNSTFLENRALVGGAVTSSGADISLVHCTLYGNLATGSASAKGGALFNSGGTTLAAYNSIIWNNSSPQISQYLRSTPPVVEYSNVQGGYEGEGNIDEDPGFVNIDAENFHLRSDSPCVDAGADFALMPDRDVDGDDRIIDGDADGIAVPDMGADEYLGAKPQLLAGKLFPWR